MSSEQIREGEAPRYFYDDDDYRAGSFTRSVWKRDRDHLRVLSIIYYIYGGLTIFGGLFTLIYVAMGVAMVSGTMSGAPNGPPQGLGIFFIILGSVFCLMFESFGVCVLVAARSLGTQRRYVFCFVVAVCLLLSGIMGIVLGVFTIIVLVRESVKELFRRGPIALSTDEDYE
jgi:hypothetical protein